MKKALGGLVLTLIGCAPAPDVEVFAGRYGQALFDSEGEPAPGWPSVGWLSLESDGSYDCRVWNGMTADGCGTFEGAGQSFGTWEIFDGSVIFSPLFETSGLALSFRDAAATHADGELVLAVDGRRHRLVSPEEQEREIRMWEQRSSERR